MKIDHHLANLISIIIIVLAVSCGEHKKAADNPADIAALEEIKKEKWLIEAVITDADVMYISMNDDGSKQDGYAAYACGILNQHKSMTKWVKIVKVNSSKDPNADNAYGVLLGECDCNFPN